MPSQVREAYAFGDFELDLAARSLTKSGTPVSLAPKTFDLLAMLVRRPGTLLSKREIIEELWPDTFVEEANLSFQVATLRKALGENSSRWIETVPKHGYRFNAPVKRLTTDLPSSDSAPALAGGALGNDTQNPPGAATAAKHSQWRRILAVAMLLAGIGAVLAIFASGWVAIHVRNTGSSTHPGINSLVVLPLKNLSGDPEQEYLADGMTEALVSRLSGIHDLRVISRTTSMHLKNSELSVPEIAKALQVDVVVEGSVIREGNRIRVTSQLIRGTTDEHFWSETYDRELPDVLALQSAVAQAIARKVEVTITGKEEQRLTASHTVLPQAYESYLKGRFSLTDSNTRAGVEKSIRYFEDAIGKDPAFAPAYVGLASAHIALGSVVTGGDPGRERPQVLSAARKALELDPNLAEAHLLLATTEEQGWHWAEAEAEYQRALELNPNDSDAYAERAWWLLCKGRTAEALASAEQARELDRFGSTTWDIAWILFNSRRYDEAIRELRGSLAVRPNDAGTLRLLGFTLVLKGQASEAIPTLERAAALADRSSGFIDLLGAAYARAGRRSDALRILAELKRRKQHGYVAAASFVIVYLGLGENEQAFAWLEEAYKEQSNMLQFVKVLPLFDSLRGDPRFIDLIHRVGLG